MDLSHLGSERFIHRALVNKAKDMVGGLLGRYLGEVVPMAVYWPAVECRDKNGQELTVFIQEDLPKEARARKNSMVRALSNVQAYGMALLTPEDDCACLVMETVHGAASWRVHPRFGTGSTVLVRIEVTHEHLGLLWVPTPAQC